MDRRETLKRAFDFTAAAVGLVLLAPLFAVIAGAIRLESPGPVMFRQERVGLGGRIFRIHKFRSMHVAQTSSSLLTVGKDQRITRVGACLRRLKLDELPQLIDVLTGAMSLVGPRPEVPRYVECYPSELRDLVLSVRPGITDRASIEFKDENALLATAADPERAYVEEVLPRKLALYANYIRDRSFAGDLRIICATIFAIGNPQ